MFSLVQVDFSLRLLTYGHKNAVDYSGEWLSHASSKKRSTKSCAYWVAMAKVPVMYCWKPISMNSEPLVDFA